MSTRSDDIEIVLAGPEHQGEILDLLASALSWYEGSSGTKMHHWKHRENPFGPSPEWVALADGRVVGYRAFMPWEFDRDGERVRAVRAVDTATRPEYRGRQIFTRLTLGALESLRADGVEFVFNTPNTQSRPGYLKMGWQVVARLPIAYRVSSPRTLARLAASKVGPNDPKASVGGMSPLEALADGSPVRELLASAKRDDRLQTRRSVEYLRWRYSPDALGYRAVTIADRPSDGLAIFRVRSRGPVVAAAICELLVPDEAPGALRDLLRAVTRTRGVDYVMRLSRGDARRGFVRLPGRGPVLTWRGLRQTEIPVASEWNLELGDVELF